MSSQNKGAPPRQGLAGGGGLTFALVCRIGGQGVSEKSASAPVTVDAGRVVDALQALSRHAVAVSDGVGVDVVVALAQAAEPHGAVSAQRVPKVAIVTELAPLACARRRSDVTKERPSTPPRAAGYKEPSVTVGRRAARCGGCGLGAPRAWAAVLASCQTSGVPWGPTPFPY